MIKMLVIFFLVQKKITIFALLTNFFERGNICRIIKMLFDFRSLSRTRILASNISTPFPTRSLHSGATLLRTTTPGVGQSPHAPNLVLEVESI